MIGTAIQKNLTVYVYDEKNRRIFSKSGELYGYTSSSVSIKKGNTVYVYNDRGARTGSHSVK
jgi:hypothetical protein